jgi:hypothetical protein
MYVSQHMIHGKSSNPIDLDELRFLIEPLQKDHKRALIKWLRADLAAVERAERSARRAARKAAATIRDERPFYRCHALGWSVAVVITFVLAEAAIFRLGWYSKLLEPYSSTGTVEYYLHWLNRTRRGTLPEVMVVGDSRIAEGFSAQLAAEGSGNQIKYWMFGIGGSSPRDWYYIVRDADRTRKRFAAIALELTPYEDEDLWDSLENRLMDLTYVADRLNWWDCPAFAFSMRDWGSGEKALAGCLFRGLVLRRDLKAFLQDIPDRVKRARDWRTSGLLYVNGYQGRTEDLHGLSADFSRRTISYPPGLSQIQRGSIQAVVMAPPAPQTGETTRYRTYWFGKILDLYKNSNTQIVFYETPRAPVRKPESRFPATFLTNAMRRQANVAALPEVTFRDLEQGDYFFDGLHLNRRGRAIFSSRIGEQISLLIERSRDARVPHRVD